MLVDAAASFFDKEDECRGALSIGGGNNKGEDWLLLFRRQIFFGYSCLQLMLGVTGMHNHVVKTNGKDTVKVHPNFYAPTVYERTDVNGFAQMSAVTLFTDEVSKFYGSWLVEVQEFADVMNEMEQRAYGKKKVDAFKSNSSEQVLMLQ